MPLHDTSFRKSAVSTKARKDRRFTRSGLRNIPNTQKSEKVRWGRGDLSGLFLLTTLSEPYLHGETAVKEICVRPMSIWKGTYILIENMPIGSNRGLWVQTDTNRFKSRVIGSTLKINSIWYSAIPKKIEIC